MAIWGEGKQECRENWPTVPALNRVRCVCELPVQIVEFRVPMCCTKCVEKVREELSELEGVYEVFVDQFTERVTVTGYVDPHAALKKMKRIKKKSEYWNETPVTKTWSHERRKTSHKKHSPRHETVYRSSSSKLSYNKKPSRVSAHPGVSFSSTYNDEPYRASYRTGYDSYDDELSQRIPRSLRDMPMYRKASAEWPMQTSRARGLISHRNPYYDEPFRTVGSDRGLAYQNGYDSYDDEPSRRGSSSWGLPHRNRSYLAENDEAFNYRRPSSPSVRNYPRSHSSRYESVAPLAQTYYSEDYPQYLYYWIDSVAHLPCGASILAYCGIV